MHPNELKELLAQAVDAQETWRANWTVFEPDASLDVPREQIERVFAEYTGRLRDNYPFFHPSYAGQMLKPPHPVAVLGYLTAQLINPNNHALDGGPATGAMEKEVVLDLARMFGWEQTLGHLTGGGTMANLEALWVARRLHPERAIAFSDQAHYTHRRMCEVLGLSFVEVPSDMHGRMDVDALRRLCLSENIGTIVATIGTTALGALDPLHTILDVAHEHGARVHADAAYGGFFTLLAGGEDPQVDPHVYSALQHCDSIVIDPHKHGLQPYGCGAVLFADPSVGAFYKHDSPYTYFTSNELHLGEISLECSRPGAAAAALWFTLKCLPLHQTSGLGRILSGCRAAAVRWSDLIRSSRELSLVLEPELDIIVYFAGAVDSLASTITRLSDSIFERAMHDAKDPVYVSKLRIRTALLQHRYPGIIADAEWTTVLRSVLMKPEHLHHAPRLHARMEAFARGALHDLA